MKFGFLPRKLEIATSDFTITTVLDWRAHRANLEAGGLVHKGWLYKPRRDDAPQPVGRYQLPETHEILSSKYDEPDLQQFIVLALGFLLGLRLLPEGWGHLHGTAIEPGKCNGFMILDKEIIPCLVSAAEFYLANNQSRNIKRLQSAISLVHWSQGLEQYFDRFNYLYMAIDACWAVCADVNAPQIAALGKRRITHPERPVIMQQMLGLKLPAIFDPNSSITAADIRNDLIHEGLVGDMAIGLSIIQPHCEHEMREFADKCIIALLGIKAGYLDTAGGDRQRHALALK
jgi:hypothetical protein